VIGQAFPDPYLQPPPEPYDSFKETQVIWGLQERYKEALKAGKTAEAEELSRQLAPKLEESRRRDAERAARAEAMKPPGKKQIDSERSEEHKLNHALEALARKATTLDRQKTKLLRELLNSTNPADFKRVNEVEGELGDLNHRVEAIRLRLGEIQHNRQRRREATERAAEHERHRRHEEAIKQKVADCEAMIKEAPAAWQEFSARISALRARALSVDGTPQNEKFWLAKMIEAIGAIEVPHGVGGLMPALVFRMPQAAPATAANNGNPPSAGKPARAKGRRE
jgi:hypothetical protein